jgi:ubiquitin carboxyl-terminal hydrolase 36/42
MNNDYYCGLNNHGNTCFFNSALQNILRCSVFINIISNLNVDHELIKIFKKLIDDYKENSNGSISPIELVKYYSKINTDYSIGSQDDAEEAVTLLIGKVDDIINTEIKNGNLQNVTIKGDIKLDKIINYLFGVTIVTSTKCMKCSNVSNRSETEFKIKIGMDNNISNNLETLIDNYSNVEEMTGDNQYDCSKCKSKVDALKMDKIVKTPKYLHVQLKRFMKNDRRGRISKIDSNVDIPSTLNILGNKYNLRGSILHMGSYHGGHYVYLYNKDKMDKKTNMANKTSEFNDWKYLDDGRISNRNVTNDIKQGYLYLYVKE